MVFYQVASSIASALLIAASIGLIISEMNPHAAPMPDNECDHDNLTLMLRSPLGQHEYKPQVNVTEFAQFTRFHNITESRPLLIVVRRDEDMQTMFLLRITLYVDDNNKPYASMYLR